MRSIRLLGTFALVLAISSLGGVAGAGPQDAGVAQKIFGYQDRQTGTFHPIPSAVPATSTTATGRYYFYFTVTVKTPFPKGSIVGCYVNVYETSYNGSTSSYFDETATGTVAAAATGTVQCNASMYYSWLIPTTVISTTISGSYTVCLINPAGSGIGGGGSTGFNTDALRCSSSALAIVDKLPANGVTTELGTDVTL